MIFRRCALIALLVISGVTAQAETWTTLNGQQFDAVFRGMWGNAAIFERADGKRAAITLLNMQAESRIRLEKLNQEVEARRAQRVKALRQQATAAAVPDTTADVASGDAASLPAMVDYQPMSDAMDLKQTVTHLLNQSASGLIRAYWDALPASYQSDIDQLRSELTGKIPASTWDARIGLLNKLFLTLQQKEGLLMGSSMLASFPGPTKDSIRAGLSPLVDQMVAILERGQLSHASVASTEMASLLATVSPELSGPLRNLAEMSKALGGPVPNIDQMQIEQTDDEHGTVTDSAAGETSQWSRVETRWISDAISADWSSNLQATGGQIESFMGEGFDEKAMQLSTVLDGLMAAQDQQAFDAVIFQVVLQMGPMLKQFGVAPAMPGGF
ncbi:hypothetical protein Poly24_32020 [Rosistilla carotiformis]|uniref:SLA1 homology domain-containing protein n=1 Tax=Rosistilla carotiformis TaxID=2528017 RepID=A0A518JVD4_9BACT|nr:hypothetical protein [Rosistilla carotiformis]QDV69486.1 hypothetical protein Poly24_32020 [Rosistilla carotiformis]